MEFFRRLPINLPEGLPQQLGIADLAACCASIDRVLTVAGDRGTIYCLWGEFEVHREPICGGVRFTLPHCPNALAWTITREEMEPGSAQIVLHCTINRERHEPDFIESIHLFLDDWQQGLLGLSRPASRNAPPAAADR